MRPLRGERRDAAPASRTWDTVVFLAEAVCSGKKEMLSGSHTELPGLFHHVPLQPCELLGLASPGQR